jgi:hypothetical protein
MNGEEMDSTRSKAIISKFYWSVELAIERRRMSSRLGARLMEIIQLLEARCGANYAAHTARAWSEE